ncbi:MAG: formate--tetrahydrofolate ligase [Candidatus Promineifilaceae bacterium]|jgi:methylenetetrahydrofolate dehydrogenase (NADP+)/methenyltetrahydrofolate cyclohydrolase/formyltetrahydrofolate synthetase/formate--tetrahydrofolate ligase
MTRQRVFPVPSDLDIAQAAEVKPIKEIADDLGIDPQDLILFGNYKAKVHLDVMPKVKDRPRGKYIDVTAITPTPLGEGKTTTAVGLVQGLGVIGKKSIACIRQPSMGPTFGIKGGAAGGGYSQIVPMEDFNLHLTGDIHAITAAHNLVAAAIDARYFHESRMSDEQLAKIGLDRIDIDPYNITWNRVIDVNDRSLRNIITGLGGKWDGRPRQAGYDITVASEIMAILALVNGHDYKSALKDLRDRAGRVVIGTDNKGKPITLEELQVAGAVAVLMKDTLHPNLMQTLEGQPAFVHAGPFANIAHGNSSILADQVALHLGEYIVTESGFGADIGMEKFFDIKCRYSELIPDAVVLVATIRALKMHGGGPRVVPGKPLDQAYKEENLELLEAGLANLGVHIRNAKKYGIPVVVAINKFTEDTAAEIDLIREYAISQGAETAVMTDHWTNGGDGAVELAEAVVAACEKPSDFKFLYPLDIPIKEKIEIIAKEIYQAGSVSFDPLAERQIKSYEENGFGDLPICMAKTHLSISHDPTLKNAPSGYELTVREARASVGAGFIYPLLGEMRTMPGLGSKPAYMNVDIDEDGNVIGLF